MSQSEATPLTVLPVMRSLPSVSDSSAPCSAMPAPASWALLPAIVVPRIVALASSRNTPPPPVVPSEELPVRVLLTSVSVEGGWPGVPTATAPPSVTEVLLLKVLSSTVTAADPLAGCTSSPAPLTPVVFSMVTFVRCSAPEEATTPARPFRPVLPPSMASFSIVTQ